MVGALLWSAPFIYIGITASETEEAAEIDLKVENSILDGEISGKRLETLEKSL